jgi:hypothetical protein
MTLQPDMNVFLFLHSVVNDKSNYFLDSYLSREHSNNNERLNLIIIQYLLI